MPLPSPRPRLGAFELTARIGRGGMGEVWGGRDGDGRPVAIKVITDSRARKERFRAAFRNEARAMASMQHPAIATVLDFGELASPVLLGGDRPLRAGTPYLVMERLGQPLDPHRLARHWPGLRVVLLALLEGLARAHARGLVHRDLKPDNILFTLDGAGVKITDFGVAHAMHAGHGPAMTGSISSMSLDWEALGAAEGGMVGTPDYMAPEQVKGEVWAHGPWTDLYALGCLAYKVATGQGPFERGQDQPLAVMMAHLASPVPPLQARMAVPAGFEQWVQRLLAKAPEARFRKAADAAWALRRLGGVSHASLRLSGGSSTGGSTVVPLDSGANPSLDSTIIADPGAQSTEVDARPPTFVEAALLDAALLETGPLPSVATDGAAYAADTVPPMSADWRMADDSARTTLVGVGLGLFGLRRVPFVGREVERDLLWSMLRIAHDSGTAQAAVLRGPSGFGKTRLAEWLLERADELGAATGVRVVHGPNEGPGHGLPGMLERTLRCVSVPRDELNEHIQRMLKAQGGADEDTAATLREIIAPTVDPTAATRVVRFARPDEQYAAIYGYLRRLARERPVVVLLDDIQFGRDSLAFCNYVLDMQTRHPAPLLMMLTARDESLTTRPETAERLAALAKRDVVQVDIGALPDEERPALLQAMLGLDPELSRRIAERTAGNALFAVQLIGDWVQRGVLTIGEDGFEIEPGAAEAMPADLASVWQARAEQLLAERPGVDARTLELAATLGLQVSGAEWRMVCAAAGLSAELELVEALLDEALARCGPEGPAVRWAFVHGMLREALLQRARNDGRLRLHHRTIARVLARDPRPRVRERVAHHLLAAGRPEEAIPHMVEAVGVRLDAGEYDSAATLLLQGQAAMAALPDSDPYWGHGWLLASRLFRSRGDLTEAAAYADRAADGAQRFRWRPLEARTRLERGINKRSQGLYAEAETLFREAARGAPDGDPVFRATCSEELGLTLLRVGEQARGVVAFNAARAAYSAAGDALGVGRCEFGLARVHLRSGELESARACNTAARANFEAGGARGAVASCLLMEGELARRAGELDEAAMRYRQSLEIYERLGSGNADYARLNLGLTLLGAGRGGEARPLLEAALAQFTRQSVRVAVVVCRSALLAVMVEAGDQRGFFGHLLGVRSLVERFSINDAESARLLENAARRAVAIGWDDEARDAARTAVAMWAALGEDAPDPDVRALAELESGEELTVPDPDWTPR